jgi:hypothetical protein
MTIRFTFGKKTTDYLQSSFSNITSGFHSPLYAGMRSRFALVDNYIARESQEVSKLRQARIAIKQHGDKSKVMPQEMPMVYTKLSTAHAFLVNLFLRGFPIFAAVTPRELNDVGRQINALIERDQQRFGWRRQLSLALRDGLKYNMMVTETSWHRQFRATTVDRAEAQALEYEGNRILRWNPYNVIYDQRCDINEVHREGEYLGYVHPSNLVAAKRFVHNLDDEFKQKQNIKRAFESAPSNLAITPNILAQFSGGNNNQWENFFGFLAEANTHRNVADRYEFVTLYQRIIPKEYDIISAGSGSPRSWKFIYLNGILIYAQPLTEWDFPAVISQFTDEGVSTEAKSYCENLMDLQDYGSFLMNARQASLRRAVSDRALYDKDRIAKADIDAENPEAKIPVKPNQFNKDLASAYHRIPYDDTMAQSYANEMAQVDNFGDEVSGISKPFQGSFIKGNRTMREFEEIMGNAESRLEVMGLLIATNNIHEIKTNIKRNYYIHAISETLFEQNSRQEVAVDNSQIRQFIDRIVLADGSEPSGKILSSENFQAIMQALPAIPELNTRYDVAELFVHIIKNQGMADLDDFRREEQPQQAQPGQEPPAEGGI